MAALGAPTMIAQSGPKTAIKISNHNLWAQVHYSKNSFLGKANTKIARDFEPALGEPRCARRASVSLLCRASRGQFGRQNSWKFNIGAFVWRNPNLFWTKLTCSAPPPLANARQQAKNFLHIFWFCARRLFLLKGKENFFAGFCSERAGGGASLRLGRGGIPPTPPFRRALAWLAKNFCGGFMK